MSEAMQTRKFRFQQVLPILGIGVVAVLGAYFYGNMISFDALRENREMLIAWRDSNFALAGLSFVLLYIAIVAFSLPGATILTLTGGFLFGIVFGVLFSVTGATIGAVLIFLAAKTGFGDFLHDKMQARGGRGGLLAKMEAGLHENEVSYLFLMRLVPAIPFFIANLAPAFLGVKLRNYVFTTFFGIMPGSVVYNSVGAGLGEVFAAGGTPNLGLIFEPRILLPILGLCVLAALPICVKVLGKKKDKTP